MEETMRSIARLLLSVGAVFALSAFLLAACGNGDDEDPTNTPAAVATATNGGSGEGGGDAAAGEVVYAAQCAPCHSIDGTENIGPTWQGLWGHEVELEDGTTVTVDEEYATTSIREPGAQVVADFEPVMPPFDLSDEEIANVIAFMQTLQ
jgi:cytochrome c oxidase subunit 2